MFSHIRFSLLWLCTLLVSIQGNGQQKRFSEKMAATMLAQHQDSIAYVKEGKKAHWEYEQGILLKAMERMWEHTGDAQYFQYIQKIMDQYVQPDGQIKTYQLSKYNIDMITPGRLLLTLYQQSLPQKEKYKKAADILYKQLQEHPRTQEGGFWHKKIYPYQMWLDGLYMGQPFYAEYSLLFGLDANWEDIANQFVWMEKNSRNPQTGLLYHGWDESKAQAWAHPETGQSPNYWSRAMGWYAMALVDVLDYFPANHPRRDELIAILQRFLPAVIRYQDAKTGGWYQVTDRMGDEGNYIEASGTAMFTYSIAKAVRKQYLAASYFQYAKKAYEGIQKNLITTDENGQIHLENTVSVSGLGGKPYRDGSYNYYLSEKIRQDDMKGVAPLIFASIEMELAENQASTKFPKVGLDYHFNREFRKNVRNQTEQFHYTWEDRMHSGFWWFGKIIAEKGATLQTVQTAPTRQNLKDLSVYILVDPDTPKETTQPNYIEENDRRAILDWVKKGGTLLLLANDTSNCEIPRFNTLANTFGIHFTDKNINMVKKDQFDQGNVDIKAGNMVFPNPKSVYIKELSPISISKNAQCIVEKDGDCIIAISRFGKGKVLAVGDPWLYNEYVDGRKIPAKFKNFEAAHELAAWLLH